MPDLDKLNVKGARWCALDVYHSYPLHLALDILPQSKYLKAISFAEADPCIGKIATNGHRKMAQDYS